MQYILDQLGVGTVVEHKKFGEGVIAEMEKVIEKESLDALCESRSSIACMAMPRAQEIFACFDRYRKLKL